MALASLGFCAYAVVTAPRGRRGEAFRPFLLYGGVAAALSLPQLINFTFVQAAESDHFLRFQFNWCNNRGGTGRGDPYCGFNINTGGFPYRLSLLARRPRRRGDRRDEAERAAALTDGLYAKAPAPAAVEEAETATSEARPDLAEAEPPAPDPAAPAEPDEEESEPPLRQSLYAHEMPAYGESSLLADADEAAKITATRPYIRPLPPDKLRAAAFSPEDDDRVGVMRAVTGWTARASRRPCWRKFCSPPTAATRRPRQPSAPGASSPRGGNLLSDHPPARGLVRQNRLIAGARFDSAIAELIIFQPMSMTTTSDLRLVPAVPAHGGGLRAGHLRAAARDGRPKGARGAVPDRLLPVRRAYRGPRR